MDYLTPGEKLRAFIVTQLLEEAGWWLRLAGRLVEDSYSRERIDAALLGMWLEGIWVRRVDGSSFEVH